MRQPRFNSGRTELYAYGRPRLAFAREFFLSMDQIHLDRLRRFYLSWRDLTEYGLIKIDKPGCSPKYIAVKCSKRGNDVHARRIKDRFAPIYRYKGSVQFFSKQDEEPLVSVLFVTLTWYGLGPINRSWEKNGDMFNVWINYLRWKYGKLSYVRDWDSTQKGYAHVHLMIIFHEAKFETFKQNTEDGPKWRIKKKAEFERSWPYFVDVEAVQDYGAVLNYIRKRILNGTDRLDQKEQGELTLALMWLFRKKSFAVSGKFFSALADLMSDLRTSKLEREKDLRAAGIVCVWIGVIEGFELGLNSSQWCAEVKDPPMYKVRKKIEPRRIVDEQE